MYVVYYHAQLAPKHFRELDAALACARELLRDFPEIESINVVGPGNIYRVSRN